MKTFKIFITIIIVGFITCFGFSSCSDDDDNVTISSDLYKVEVNFGSGAENYFKQVSVAGATSDGRIAIVKDSTGKELTTPSLSDNNYTFATNNTFEFIDKAVAFSLTVSVSHQGSVQHDPVTIETKIYKGGKLVYEDQGTATSSKSYTLSKTY